MNNFRIIILTVFSALVFVLSSGSIANAAITLVQNGSGMTASGTSVANSPALSAIQSGNLLIVVAANRTASTMAPVISGSGWSLVPFSGATYNATPGQVVWYKIAGAGEPTTITVNSYSVATPLGLEVFEYSGILTSSPLDQYNQASGSSTSANPGSVNTTQPIELVLAGVISNVNTSPSGWTNSFAQRHNFLVGSGGSRGYIASADLLPSTSSSYTTTVTTGSGAWRAQIVSFKGIVTTTIGTGTNPSDKTVDMSTTNKAVDAFTLSTNSGTDTVTSLTATFSGTAAADVAASGVKLWLDNGSTPNEWDSGDTQVGSAVSFSGTTATFSGLSISVTTTSAQYLITYDISASAGVGDTLQGKITAASATNPITNSDTTNATLTVTKCPGGVVTTTADTGNSSLRECINSANGSPGTIISFNIATAANQSSGGDSWWRITAASVLPTITAANTTIDGTTQTTNQGNSNTLGPEIEIFGNSIAAHGLNISGATGVNIKGLVINKFGNGGVVYDGIYINNATNTSITGCYIGTNAIATAALANDWNGIEIQGTSSGTVIGGASAGAGNIISGNATQYGIAVLGTSTGTVIKGNTIGTGVAGTETLGNMFAIRVDTAAAATNNVIGGVNAGEGNLIANSSKEGIILATTGTGDTVQGNTLRNNGAVPGGQGGAIFVNTVRGIFIAKNLIYSNNQTGIALNIAGATTTKIYQNTIHASTDYGIDVYSTGSIIKNNIITGNGRGIQLQTGASMTEAYNLVTDASTNPANTSGQSNVALDATDKNIDPLYTNVGTGDFTLTACTSPAINAGVDLVADQPDMNGGSPGNFNGSAPDMGAFETTCSLCPGGVVTTTSDAGAGSLRECINQANITPGMTISFNIATAANQSSGGDSWWRISPASALPTITAANTTIDGTTQTTNKGNTNSKGPEIELNGAGAGVGASGLNINNTANATIRDLVINGFAYYGVVIQGASATGARVYGSYIGTNAIGGAAAANLEGIYVITSASNIDIGGQNAGEGNLISGNTNNGIYLTTNPNTIRVYGNKIGTDRTATVKIPNQTGIRVWTGANSVTVGGSSLGQGNVVSGNVVGIYIGMTASGITIRGNTMGSGATGTENLGNTNGIFLDSSAVPANIVIGGSSSGEGNLISYNAGYGISAGNARTGGFTAIGNTIRDNVNEGINTSWDNAVIAANLIYRNGTGATKYDGVNLLAAADGAKVFNNTIHGNGKAGILAAGTNAVIKNNIITGSLTSYGLNVTGTMSESYNLITDAATTPANASGRSNVTLATTDLNDNPLYTNSGTGDFTLQNTSPAINRGIDLGSDQPDMNGASAGNFNGYAPDMGYWESAVTTTCPVSSTADSGAGTLRACITYANSNPGTTISFNIATAANQSSGGDSWWRISPLSVLPSITAANTVIDGTTQTTNKGNTNTLGPEIEINGASAGSVDGITITAANTTIRGLIVNGFNVAAKAGLLISGAGATGNRVEGNYLGTNFSGTAASANNVGVNIMAGANGNFVDGTAAAGKNVISGNSAIGVWIQGSGSNTNTVIGNYIGVNRTGTGIVGNSQDGVLVSSGAKSNEVGGDTAAKRNIISGNGVHGVTITDSGSDSNTVMGNYIGTDVNGTVDLGNLLIGVYISLAAKTNTIGGTVAARRNVISGNDQYGVGIAQSGTDSNIVKGNYIGTQADGVTALPNGVFGVAFWDMPQSNTIGGTVAGEGNVIAYNTTTGVVLFTASTIKNTISGNSIFGNGGMGIDLGGDGVGGGDGSNNNKARPTITAITANGANFDISATVTSGDTIEFFRVNNAAAPVVTADGTGSGEGYLYLGKCVDNGACSGPYISGVTDANGVAGTVKITLTAAGVASGDSVTATATDATNGTSEFAANMATPLCIGGVVTSTADTGAGSLRECINFANSSPGSTISFDIATATNQSSGGDSWWRISPATALPTITAAGTIIDGTTQTTNNGDTNSKGPEIEVYGASAGATVDGLKVNNVANVSIKGLVINSFNGFGINLLGAGVTGSTIYGNYIGTNATGSAALANTGSGIYLSGIGGASIGGTTAGMGNLISGNGTNGIELKGSSTNVTIQGNKIGTDSTGTAKIANAAGSGIFADQTVNTITIGGSAAGAPNIISGNGQDGITILGTCYGFTIYGNTIGSGIAGTENLGNGLTGISIATGVATSSIIIGGVNSGEGNLIANSYMNGIGIGINGASIAIKGNTIYNSGFYGINNQNVSGVVIAKNLINGSGWRGNFDGITLTTGATNNKIYQNTINGGSRDGIRVGDIGAIIKNNIITGNAGYGINRVAASMTEAYNLITDASTSPANASGRSNVALAISDRDLDPRYVNAGSGNFSLTECSSPAINAGTDLGVDQPDMNGPAAGNWNGILPDMGALESSCSGANDIAIDGNFAEWDNGAGNEFCMNDQGGVDDWTSPAKLDITKYCIGSNLTDRFFVLFGFDDTSFANDATGCVLLDTDSPADNNINKALCVTVNGTAVQTMTLYNCDNSIAGGCSGATVSKTYTGSDYAIGTVAGPFGGSDTFIEAQLPFADLGVSLGNIVFTSLVTYPGAALLKTPKDSIFGTGGNQNYNDRIQYDTAGIGAIQGNGSIPSVSGNVYTDEGTTTIGPGKTVHLLRNGLDGGTNTTDANGGYYIQNASLAAGDSILVYIDNDGTYKGTTVSVFNSSNITGLDIYAGRVITRQDNGGALSNVNMDTAKGASGDTDIEYSVAAGALNVSGTATLYVPTGHSFTPGNTITTPAMKNLGTFNGGSFSDTINGAFTVAGGAYTATSGTTSVAGDFTYSSGTITHNNGTFIFNGTDQSITGSTTFNNLTKSVTTARTLTFEAGSTTTVNGTCTLNGASGQLLSLVSSSSPTKWNLVLGASATKAISYVSVKDSDASGSNAAKIPVLPTSSTNAGNTVSWFIDSPAGVYYSVGQSVADLKVAATVTITSGAAVFSAAQTGNIGVGDRVTYNTNVIAYISAKSGDDKMHWSLVTATGGVPADIAGSTVVSIKHEYPSLSAAIAGASDVNHINNADLTASNVVLNVPCYYDSGADTTAVTVSGYTTGATNYIKIYTPSNTSTEANYSQRHLGKWDDAKYSLQPTANADTLTISNQYTRVEGLQLALTTSNSNNRNVVYLNPSANYAALSGNLIISGNASGTNQTGIAPSTVSNPIYIYNNILYGFGTANSQGMDLSTMVGAIQYVYNNTVYGSAQYGIHVANLKTVLINNLAYNNGLDYFGTGNATHSNNISKDASSPDAAYQSKTVAFVNAANNDFHLSNIDTAARGSGADLSADPNLAFGTDIDGQPRPAGSAWDIGADQVYGALRIKGGVRFKGGVRVKKY